MTITQANAFQDARRLLAAILAARQVVKDAMVNGSRADRDAAKGKLRALTLRYEQLDYWVRSELEATPLEKAVGLVRKYGAGIKVEDAARLFAFVERTAA